MIICLTTIKICNALKTLTLQLKQDTLGKHPWGWTCPLRLKVSVQKLAPLLVSLDRQSVLGFSIYHIHTHTHTHTHTHLSAWQSALPPPSCSCCESPLSPDNLGSRIRDSLASQGTWCSSQKTHMPLAPPAAGCWGLCELRATDVDLRHSSRSNP